MSKSAMRADVDRKTAQKYIKSGKTPEEHQSKHDWRTRADPVEKIWAEAERRLNLEPTLEAKALFEFLLEAKPGQIEERHLRTFQRRVSDWKLTHGPEKEVFFQQINQPGMYLEIDWTDANELGVTIEGCPLKHLLFHATLKYSNWEWAKRCKSESLLSLRRGLQASLFELGRVPEVLRMDNSSSATHRVGRGADRTWNKDFLSILQHYDLRAEAIQVGCPNENGDVESANGHLKSRWEQQLLLRGSRDFKSEADYDNWGEALLRKANQGRAEKLADELGRMRTLPPTRLSDYDELYCRVSRNSTIRVKKVTYSVPARWVGKEVKVEVYESQLKVYHGRDLLLEMARASGDQGAVIQWRHLIGPLLRKPGAFARYRWREEFFPTDRFRAAYDQLVGYHGSRTGDLEYLRLLELAAEITVEDTENLMGYYMQPFRGKWWVKQLRGSIEGCKAITSDMPALKPDLSSYDALLTPFEEAMSHGS